MFEEALQGRLVEAEFALELLDELRRQAAGAEIALVRRPRRSRLGPPPAIPSNTSPCPSSWAMICSIGPPGTNWVRVKLTIMIPISVGITSSSRLRI
jgi:hypothetical protein